MGETVGTINIGGDVLELQDPGVAPVFVDFIGEASNFGGLIRVGLVAAVASGDGPVRGVVVQRFRMNLGTAADLRNALSNLLDANAEAREKAN